MPDITTLDSLRLPPYRDWPPQLECWLNTLCTRASDCPTHNHPSQTLTITSAKRSTSNPDTIVLKGKSETSLFAASGIRVREFRQTLIHDDLKSIFDWEEEGRKACIVPCRPLLSGGNTAVTYPQETAMICRILLGMAKLGPWDERGGAERVGWRLRGRREDFELSLSVGRP